MDASDEDSRIVVPFIATLTNMALAVVAIQLHNKFGPDTLEEAFSETKPRRGPKLRSRNCLNSLSRVKETLHFIPITLRERFLAEVKRVDFVITYWAWLHEDINGFDYTKCTFFWRSDGTINTIRTAQDISRNQCVDLTARFEMSCRYCLKHEVQNLWKELEENGKAEMFERCLSDKPMLSFWVRWVREGARVSWIQAAQEYLNREDIERLNLYPIFRELMPAERRNYFRHMEHCTPDDFRYCLYTLTKEEQEEITRIYGSRVLETYMEWPLVRDFFEIADKIWGFLDGSQFCQALVVLCSHEKRKQTAIDFNYVIEEFWNRSPSHLKEFAKETRFEFSRNSRRRLQKLIKGRTAKRKADNNTRASAKQFKRKRR